MSERTATVTVNFPGVEEGKVYPRTICAGEKLTGRLAEEAVMAGFAKWSGGKVEKTPPQTEERDEAIADTVVALDPNHPEGEPAAAAPEKRRPGRPSTKPVEG
jgi:hypothetical protein